MSSSKTESGALKNDLEPRKVYARIRADKYHKDFVKKKARNEMAGL